MFGFKYRARDSGLTSKFPGARDCCLTSRAPRARDTSELKYLQMIEPRGAVNQGLLWPRGGYESKGSSVKRISRHLSLCNEKLHTAYLAWLLHCGQSAYIPTRFGVRLPRRLVCCSGVSHHFSNYFLLLFTTINIAKARLPVTIGCNSLFYIQLFSTYFVLFARSGLYLSFFSVSTSCSCQTNIVLHFTSAKAPTHAMLATL